MKPSMVRFVKLQIAFAMAKFVWLSREGRRSFVVEMLSQGRSSRASLHSARRLSRSCLKTGHSSR